MRNTCKLELYINNVTGDINTYSQWREFYKPFASGELDLQVMVNYFTTRIISIDLTSNETIKNGDTQ